MAYAAYYNNGKNELQKHLKVYLIFKIIFLFKDYESFSFI